MSQVVQSFWAGSKLPALQILSIRSFLAHGHAYHLYTFDRIENAPVGVTLFDASAILPRDSVFSYRRGFGKGSVSAFSNLFRYKLLFDCGGWWVDTDVVCLRPFDFPTDFVFATERDLQGKTTAASCAIKSPAGAPYLQFCLDTCRRRTQESLAWGEIGPFLVRDAIEAFSLERYCVPPDAFSPIDYKDAERLVDSPFDARILNESTAVHLWNQKWKSYCLDQDYDGTPDSLYAALRARYLTPEDRDVGTAQALESHAAFQRRCITELCAERDRLQHTLDDIHGSLAWKCSAPLRLLAAIISGTGRRGRHSGA
jgi:hypothetical protein